jgi:hypothetical protein
LPLHGASTKPSMAFGERLRHYKRLLASGTVRLMLEDLQKDLLGNPKVEKELIGLLGRVNKLEEDYRKGVLDYEVQTRLENAIRLSACDLLDEVGEGDF